MRAILIIIKIMALIFISTASAYEPEIAAPIAALSSADKTPALGTVITDITTTAKNKSAELTATVQPKLVEALGYANTVPIGPFIQTVTNIEMLQTKVSSYANSTKQSCASAAEIAGYMCIEGTSEGAIAAKKLMNAAGPMLAATTSAQKACSETSNITDLIAKGLTLAKGACVASKLACDASCGTAAADLKAMELLVSKITTDLTADLMLAIANCEKMSATTAAVVCGDAAQNNANLILKAITAVKAGLGSEAVPATPGTTPFIALKCKNHLADIALFAANIFTNIAASKSAKECADKFQSGTPGPTQAEYCSVPANLATSFCKCQKDNTQIGCSGHDATKPTAIAKDQKGNDIKSAGHGNQFAGGFDKIKGSPIDLGGLKSDSANNSANEKKDSASGGFGTGSPTGSSPGGSSAVGASGKAADGKEAISGDDKKKSSQGSFSSSGGGSTSGGSGSSKVSNFGLGQKDMDAIQRQIAAEKLHSEVSGASGKSNWEKVTERYLRNKSTLLVGQ